MQRNKVFTMNSSSNRNIEEAFDSFLSRCEYKTLSPWTITSYKQYWKIFVRYLGNDNIDTSSITVETVEEYLIYLKDNYKGNDVTRATNIRSVRVVLYYYMEKGWTNPFKVTIPKSGRTIKEVYSETELKKLLKKPDLKTCTFAELRNWTICSFFIGTGCRARTLTIMNIGDLNLQSGEVLYRHTKNGKQQNVPLSKVLIRTLKIYISFRQGNANELLFPTIYGTELAVDSLGKEIKKYNFSRGVYSRGLHKFRHTFATLWISNGGDPFTLQRILGHSDLSMVNRYLQISSESVSKTFARFNPLESLNSDTERFNMTGEVL
ncbi:MAG: Tyrosine recombinase XerC [Candidatus Izimaplasma bacterium HR2]|nr:MAG: Tyrosine recombinase XerC [Candidatus Izimaplasma bacterium HR2]